MSSKKPIYEWASVTPSTASPHEKCSTAEIYGNLSFCFVHRQNKAVALYATLVAECFAQGGTRCQRNILDRVMFIDFQVAIAMDIQ